jgi:hypothetical protein
VPYDVLQSTHCYSLRVVMFGVLKLLISYSSNQNISNLLSCNVHVVQAAP